MKEVTDPEFLRRIANDPDLALDPPEIERLRRIASELESLVDDAVYR
jgi:hypothetical protein